MKSYLTVLSVVACVFLLSCNSNTEKTASPNTETAALDKQWAKAFLDSMNKKFSEQFSAGDSASLASHYWPDAELLLDNSEPVKGSDILNAWGSAMRMGIKDLLF